MKNVSLFLATLMCGTMLSAAVPVVKNVTLSQDATSGDIVVSYELSDAKAIVTVDILTNGVSALTGDERGHLSGDVARSVDVGVGRTVVWHPLRFPPLTVGAVARVTAWELANPPDYLVVDLTAPNHRSYYEKLDDLPFGGISNVLYKTDRLVMRKIPAAEVVWRMGQPYPDGERCSNKVNRGIDPDVLDNETGHMVKFTADYYMSIYEMTRRQYERVIGASTGQGTVFPDYTYSKTVDEWVVPMTGPSHSQLTKSGGVIETIRTFTGLSGIGLPTEAQWEYACRAGTGTTFNNNMTILQTLGGKGYNDERANPIAWYGNDYGTSGGQYLHPVGLKEQNAFGLYDMHGNAAEICLDLYLGGDDYRATFVSGWETGAATVNPPAVADSALTDAVARGGDYFYSANYLRSASRMLHPAKGTGNQHYGFRLISTLPVE